MRILRTWCVSATVLWLLIAGCWGNHPKMDEHLQHKVNEHLQRKASHGQALEMVPVIIQTDTMLDREHLQAIQAAGGLVKEDLSVLNGVIVDLPVQALEALANHPRVLRLSHDSEVRVHNAMTSASIGAAVARTSYNANGSGIGVAIIDTGLNGYIYDIAELPNGSARPLGWVDFVNGRPSPYDDHGH